MANLSMGGREGKEGGRRRKIQNAFFSTLLALLDPFSGEGGNPSFPLLFFLGQVQQSRSGESTKAELSNRPPPPLSLPTRGKKIRKRKGAEIRNGSFV